VDAGSHARCHCPVRVRLDSPAGILSMVSADAAVAAQADGDDLVFVPATMEAGDRVTYACSDRPTGGGVRLIHEEGAIRAIVDDQEFTTYRYADVPARPYFWPVLAPGGIPVTRAWPMRGDVAGETHDHHHHRSMYFAFGSVNGTDNWSEEPGHGFTVHRSVDELVSGPVFGRFATTSDWTDPQGAPLLTQRAVVTVWRGAPSLRLLDVDLRLTASHGDVTFGDTKEGGLLTVRVATTMDVPRGGRIENSYGGLNEPETWGCAAHWCDYSGVVDGCRVGIAVMDHPTSFRFPTYWHVRDYGLMAANPFALGDYTRGARDGSHLLPAGDTLRFVYRVVVHQGDASEADVCSQYLNYVAPARAEAI
jgi:hypothetical protein